MLSENADDSFHNLYDTPRCIENYEQVIPSCFPGLNGYLGEVLYTCLHRRNDCQTIRI